MPIPYIGQSLAPAPDPIPTDAEAHDLLTALDSTNDQGQQKQIATVLGSYAAAKKAQGLEPFQVSPKDQAAQDSRLDGMFQGLDKVDSSLSPQTAKQINDSLQGVDNPDDAKAQMINQTYAVQKLGLSPDNLTQWPTIRTQIAKGLGIDDPNVTDTQLYGAIGQHIQKTNDTRALLGQAFSFVGQRILEGEPWMQANQEFMASQKDNPKFDPAQSDAFSSVAQQAYQQLADRAHILSPAVNAVSSGFTAIRNGGVMADQNTVENMINSLTDLSPQDRATAIQIGAGKTFREMGEADRNPLTKTVTAIGEGLDSATQGINALGALVAKRWGLPYGAELSDREEIKTQLMQAYHGVADPVEGHNLAGKVLYGLAQSAPSLGLVFQPEVGIPLIFSQSSNDRTVALKSQGVPDAEAHTLGNIQGGIDTLSQFVTSHMVFGNAMRAFDGTATRTIQELGMKSLKLAGVEGGTLGSVVAFQQVAPLVVQSVAAQLDKDIPQIQWSDKDGQPGAWHSLKDALPETIASTAVLMLLGTGMGTLKEAGKMNDATRDITQLKAGGYTDEQANQLAAIVDPADRLNAMVKMPLDGLNTNSQVVAVKALDARNQEARDMATAPDTATITPLDGGKFQVTDPSGKVLDTVGSADMATQVKQDYDVNNTPVAKGLSALIQHIAGEVEPENPLAPDAQATREKTTQDTLAALQDRFGADLRVEQAPVLESLAQRVASGKMTQDQAESALDVAKRINGLAQDATLENTKLNGSSSIEQTREGVWQMVANVAKSADPTVAVEEVSESYIKKAYKDQKLNPADLNDIRTKWHADQKEADPAAGLSGEALDRANIEWFSKRVVDYALANRKVDLPEGWGAWLRTLGDKLKSVIRGAAQMRKLMRDGTLDPELEALMRGALGDKPPKNPNAKNMPEWAKEEMVRRGINPSRKLNDADLENQSIQDALKMESPESLKAEGIVLKNGKYVYDQTTYNVSGGKDQPTTDSPVPAAKQVLSETAASPKAKEFTPFRAALNRFVGANQLTSLRITREVERIKAAIPDERRRIALTNWIQAAGDVDLIRQRAEQVPEAYKRGYIDALTLTPAEKQVGENIKQFYNGMLLQLQKHEVLREGIENYVNQMWERKAGDEKGNPAIAMARISTDLRNAKERTFGSYADGEVLGYKPVTKDISHLLAIYGTEAGKVLATRKFLKELTTTKASDKRPLAAVMGVLNGDKNEGAVTGDTTQGPNFITANAHPEGYSTVANNAFQGWKWLGKIDGKDVMMKGQMTMHPDIANHMKAVFEPDRIAGFLRTPQNDVTMELARKLLFGVEKANSMAKGTTLGFLSPFHQVQEGTHAVGDRINPFYSNAESLLDPENPDLQRAVIHGLMVAGDNGAMMQFMDGFDSNLMHNLPKLAGKLPGIGEAAKAALDSKASPIAWSKAYTEYLFHRYIPAIKMKAYLAIEARNLDHFSKEIAAGKMTKDDIAYLSAKTVNYGYGHMNYADMGRSATAQHFWRLVALAPDFLEARARFTGQAISGLWKKGGKEALYTMATLAALQWSMARITSKAFDDDWHFEAENMFSAIIGDRRYTMRSVPEDLFALFNDSHKFLKGRVSPGLDAARELIFQTNYRGEKVDYTDQFKDMMTKFIPITLRSNPVAEKWLGTGGKMSVPWYEQMLGSLGLHISRNSPIAEAYKLADKWKDSLSEEEQQKLGIHKDTGIYPVSPYQQLRYALEDGDLDKAGKELAKLKEADKKDIAENFRQSVLNPYAGSIANTAKFKASLTEDQRKMVDEADEARKTILHNFSLLVRSQTK